MLTLTLEPTDNLANPIFKDAAGCAQWLSQLQLTNLQLAHSQLLTQINELNRFPMSGLERLNSLELLRETVGYVQDDYAKKLIAKPLPLIEGELMVFVALVQLWQALVLGYQRCLQAYMANEPQLEDHGALLCQRCLLYSGLEIFEHLRTGYEFDTSLWHQLHDLYAFAEERGIQDEEVTDPLNTIQPRSSCRASYVKTLLSCYARPAELTRSQLLLMDRWLTLWNHVVPVERSYTVNDGDAPPLAVDLNSSRGLQPVDQMPASTSDGASDGSKANLTPAAQPAGAGAASSAAGPGSQRSGEAAPASPLQGNVSQGPTRGESLRYLPMVSLSKLLRVKIVMLQQGQNPQEIGLGEHCNRDDCIEFFTFLHQCWCEDRNKRFGERHPVTKHAQLCYKMEGIYAHLSGKPFKQPERDTALDHLAHKQIATFGRVLQDAHDKELLEMGYPLETWNLENESIMGAKLRRSDTFGGRLHYNQLIAVRPDDAAAFMLGTTAWVNVTHSGQLQTGVRFMPGTAEPVSIRATGVNMTVSDKYVPAFLLGAVPALKAPASLVIPRDWFHPNRVVEVLHQNKDKQNVKMGFSVERGIDYERVSFTLV